MKIERTVTVVITSKNRKELLAEAIESVLRQSMPLECLVIDDGSTDGTSDMVRERFPGVRLERSKESKGLIEQRNNGAQLARGEIIFSIDDDAIFSTPNVVEQTLRDFDDPKIAAVAIPFINVNQDQVVRQRAPDDEHVWIAPFYIGTAHAMRRDVFLENDGYRGDLIHQGEERDLCIRLLDQRKVIRLGRADPIHHFESPRRSSERMSRFGRRNDILFVWQNIPFPYLPIYLAATTWNGFRFALRHVNKRAQYEGLLTGYRSMITGQFKRKPVTPRTVLLYRYLTRRRAVRLDEFLQMM